MVQGGVLRSALRVELRATGAMFVEDRDFHRIGVITPLGRGYSFRGNETDPLGQGPLDELLPEFFGEGIYRAAPLH